MNPLHLRLRRCGSWDALDLDLPEGILGLVGPNGSGKSSVVNAISAALFGPDSRTFADWYPRGATSDDPLMIELVFEHAGAVYKVRRTYSPKGRGQSRTDLERVRSDAILIGGMPVEWEPMTMESQSETQDLIDRLIGVTRDSFRASSFLAQNEAGVFCEAPPRSRKQILADILGLNEWDGWLERARQDKRAAQGELDRIAGGLERAEQELAANPDIQQQRATAVLSAVACEEHLAEASRAVAVARDALADATRRAEGRAGAEIALQRAVAAQADAQRAVQARENEIETLDERLAARPVLAPLAANLSMLRDEREALRQQEEAWRDRQRLETEAVDLSRRAGQETARILALTREAERVEAGIGSETCDRCGQVLHEDAARRAAKSYRDDASAVGAEHDRTVAAIEAITARIPLLPAEAPDAEAIRGRDSAIRRAEEAVAALAALDEAAARRDAAQRELEQMRAGLPGLEQAVASARDQLDALGPHDPDLQAHLARGLAGATEAEATFRRDLDSAKATVARCDTQLERLAKVAEQAAADRQRSAELTTDYRLAAALERACGPNGVPALILETVAVPQIEAEATRILGLLGGPAYAVELHTLKQTKTAGVADTLDIVLLTEKGDAPYESFSGGERARVAFALRLALAQLLAARRGSETGLLVIDELENLDAAGAAALVSVLEGMRASVPRIIIVSHLAELRDAFAQTIVLENVDGVSRIVSNVPAAEEAVA